MVKKRGGHRTGTDDPIFYRTRKLDNYAESVEKKRGDIPAKVASLSAECASLGLKTTARALDMALAGISRDVAQAKEDELQNSNSIRP